MEISIKLKWNRNYYLLLMGQGVSSIGDAVYAIALSLFVLELTGSTTLVGTMMGLVTIPRIILGPFAGAIIDRKNKKLLIVLSDIIRGVMIVLISILLRSHLLNVWMLIIVALIDGICAAFFNPTMETTMPLIVEPENLVRANSFFQMILMGIEILGQTIGGILYSMLGAPLVFFLNGVSYLFSAGSEMFISLPKEIKEKKQNTILQDMKEGFLYIFKNKGLTILIVMSFFLNFLFGIIRVLIIPWFVQTEGFGEARLGFFNGACSLGFILGMIGLSMFTMKEEKKYRTYFVSVLAFISLVGFASLINQYVIVLIFFVIAFSFQVVFNTLMNTTIVLNTDENLRGKISATRMTLCMAASPIGNFLGGVMGEFIPPNHAIAICSFVALMISLVLILKKEVKYYFSKP